MKIPDRPLTSKEWVIVSGVIFVLFVLMIIAAVQVVNERDIDSEKERDASLQKEKEVTDMVKHYQGKDGKGDRLIDVLKIIINVAYPREDILKNPSTVVDWYAMEDFTKKDGVYRVVFFINTYREDTEFVWYVDTKTNKIFAGNEGAKSVLDAIDNFG